eukprot:scaffold54825_cov34-Tisochrysis_lutea.AAC.2
MSTQELRLYNCASLVYEGLRKVLNVGRALFPTVGCRESFVFEYVVHHVRVWALPHSAPKRLGARGEGRSVGCAIWVVRVRLRA